MDKYLLHILHEVNTIIIPGLGALTVTNKATGEIMFMSYLKHDDGNLVKHIVEKEGLSENDAKNLIAKYVREIHAKLDTGDSYDMYQFGRFIKKDGEVDFESWNSYQHTGEESSTVLEEKVETPVEIVKEEPKLKEKEEIKEIPKADETPIEEIKPIVKEKNEIIEEKGGEKEAESDMQEELADANQVIANLLDASTPNEEEKAKSLDDILNANKEAEKAKEEKIVESQKISDDKQEKVIQEETIEIQNVAQDLDTSLINPNENVYIPEEEIEKIVTEQKNEKAKPKPSTKKIKAAEPKVVKEKLSREKKSKKFWILTILGIVLLAGGATTVIFYDKIETALFGKKEIKLENKSQEEQNDENLEAIEKQVALEQEAATESSTPEVVSEKVEPEVQETKVVDGNLPYHIIVGSFGVEANAIRLAKKYSNSGKKSVVLGKFDEMYLVSYEAFATKDEAIAALKSSDVEGWVFKYSK